MDFHSSEEFARSLDDEDPLRDYRNRFEIPETPNGEPCIYFCGDSLGLEPKTVHAMMDRQLSDWATLGVEGHFKAESPWYSYHEEFHASLARLVGAQEPEVVAMNTLTVNLHLMLVSFYRPTSTRYKILMESPAFPSDIYAIKSHIASRGLKPTDALVTVSPREGEHTIHESDIHNAINQHADELAVILLGGVNFLTGQVFDMQMITKWGHEAGAMVGFDLAHGVGNIPLQLHDWDVDFACWCSYKYLNSGPGAVAGCFIHERHAHNTELPRYGGWWGNDPETRFRMHLIDEFYPKNTADGWQISNSPIFSLVPLRASLDIFDEVGMDALRKKSLLLTGYLRFLLEEKFASKIEIVTPATDDRHGCQLSLLVKDHAKECVEALKQRGIICDFRPPHTVRVAPTPLYNTFFEVWKFHEILGSILT